MCHKAFKNFVPPWKSGPSAHTEFVAYHSCPNCGYRIRTSTFQHDATEKAFSKTTKEPPTKEGENKNDDVLPEGLMAELLLNNTPTPQMILSSDNVVLFGNRAAEKLLLLDDDPTTDSEDSDSEEDSQSEYGTNSLSNSRAGLTSPSRSRTRKSIRPMTSIMASIGTTASDVPVTLRNMKLSDLPINLADVAARRWISVEAVLEQVKQGLLRDNEKRIADADDANGFRGDDDEFYNSFYDEVGNTDYTNPSSGRKISRDRPRSRTGSRAVNSGAASIMSRRKRKDANRRIATEYIAVVVEKPGEDPIKLNMFVSVVTPGGGAGVTVSETFTTISFVAAQLHMLGDDEFSLTSRCQSLRDWDAVSRISGSSKAFSKKSAKQKAQIGEDLMGTLLAVKDQILDEMESYFIATTPDFKTLITNKATKKLLGDADFMEAKGGQYWLKELEFWAEDLSEKLPFDEIPLIKVLNNPMQPVQGRFALYSKEDEGKPPLIIEVQAKPIWKSNLNSMTSELLASLMVIVDHSHSAAVEKDLRQASKTKSMFMLNVGMGLRAPIAGIVGLLEYLYRETGKNLTTEQRVLIRNIFKSINSLLLVVNDIIDYTKLESGSLKVLPQPFNFTYVMDDIRKLFTTTLRKEDVSFNIDVGLVQVVPPSRKLDLLAGHEEEEEDLDLVLVGDGQKLRRVLINLIDAALNFTTEGSVSIKVKTTWKSEDKVQVRFEVTDTGSGFPSEVIASIFQPFHQAITSFASGISGAHLGLTIANALVNEMKGELTCQSIIGIGTTMTLNLPFGIPPRGTVVAGSLPGDCLSRTMGIVMRPEDFWLEDDPELHEYSETPSYTRQSGHMGLGPRRPSQAALQDSISQKSMPSAENSNDEVNGTSQNTTKPSVAFDIEHLELHERQKEPQPDPVANNRVLVVESNWAHGVILEKRLRNLGFEVLTVTSGDKALSTMRNKVFLPDIIFMDLEMPHMNGYQCTHSLRTSRSLEHISSVPVIAITATQGDEGRNLALNAGMDDFTFKPLSDDTLTSTLRKWINFSSSKAVDSTKKRVKVLTADGDIASTGRSEARRSVTSFDTVVTTIIENNRKSREGSIASSHSLKSTKSFTIAQAEAGELQVSEGTQTSTSPPKKLPTPIPESPPEEHPSMGAGRSASENEGRSGKVADREEPNDRELKSSIDHTITAVSEPDTSQKRTNSFVFPESVTNPRTSAEGTQAFDTGTSKSTSEKGKDKRYRRKSRTVANTARRRSSTINPPGPATAQSDDMEALDSGQDSDSVAFMRSLQQKMQDTIDERRRDARRKSYGSRKSVESIESGMRHADASHTPYYPSDRGDRHDNGHDANGSQHDDIGTPKSFWSRKFSVNSGLAGGDDKMPQTPSDPGSRMVDLTAPDDVEEKKATTLDVVREATNDEAASSSGETVREQTHSTYPMFF